jgi:leucyl aminopeptidase
MSRGELQSQSAPSLNPSVSHARFIPLRAINRAWMMDGKRTLTAVEQQWASSQLFKADTGQLCPCVNRHTGELEEVWVGCGEQASFTEQSVDFFRALGDRLNERLGVHDYVIEDSAFSEAAATRAAIAFRLGQYRFTRYRAHALNTAELHIAAANKASVQAGVFSASLARDLINTPAIDCGPTVLSAEIKALAKRFNGEVREWVGDELLAAEYRLIHAVGMAGHEPPRLVEATFERNPSFPWISLIGKGVCFDTGGLDMKTSQGMALMKKDMGGAAVALALTQLLNALEVKVNVQLIVPTVLNAISSNSVRPSDVIRSKQGITVEISNTDAEGRLILADAFDLIHPKACVAIDTATLTGAARVALGPDIPVVFTEPQALFAELKEAAARAGESLWQLPLASGYADELKSKVADIANSAGHSFAGSILGALFLKRFVPRHIPWVHVDLYAWNPKDRPGFAQGGEAHGLFSLFEWIKSQWVEHSPE